jgi:PilZ domain-containing protein
MPGQETIRWLKFGLDVKLSSLTINGKPFEGSSRVGQLDATGIGVFIPANLKKHDRGVFTFSLPNSEGDITANVRFVSRTGFRYWFEFVDLEPKHLERIRNAVAMAEAK